MKKRILSLAAASCLLLILAACGGGDAPQESPSGAPASEAPVQESAPAQDSSGLPTLEDYFRAGGRHRGAVRRGGHLRGHVRRGQRAAV